MELQVMVSMVGLAAPTGLTPPHLSLAWQCHLCQGLPYLVLFDHM